LLADVDAVVSKQYGVYKQRNLYGKKYMGIERTTFVIDRTGRIAQIYPKVKVDGHIEQLIEFVGGD
jgi:peroxiredoxin Q/BCP